MSPTRRSFLVSTTSAALGGSLLRPAAVSALSRQEIQGVFAPVRENVGFFTLRGGTVGYLMNDDGLAVVDSQFPDEARVLIAGLGERSGGRRVDCLVNTHHHGDHSGGNVAFRGVAETVVAHAMAAEHMRRPPGGEPPADQRFPDATFTDSWSTEIGGERMTMRHYGRAHTSGDAVVTFERANVAHMGDLLFHRRHPVVDRAAGATLRGWIHVLDRTVEDHARDTVYIFGHAGAGLPVTGTYTDLLRFRDYLGAVLDFVQAQMQAGTSRDDVLSMEGVLPGFEDFGPFGRSGAREVRTCAWDEITQGA